MKQNFILVLALILSISISSAQKVEILNEGFEGGVMPTGWTIEGDHEWEFHDGGETGSNPANAHSGSFNATHYMSGTGESTKLITPELDFSGGTAGILNFWYAQKDWGGDCDELKIYYKEGTAGSWLEIAHYTGDADWTEVSDLLIPSSSSEVYVAFEGISYYGYGVCLDDITIATEDIENDLGVVAITPNHIIVAETGLTNTFTPTVTVKNYLTTEVATYDVTVSIEGTSYNETITVTDAIAGNAEVIITMPQGELSKGNYTITATVELTGDGVPNNNTLEIACAVNSLINYFDTDFSEYQDYHCAFPETDGENIYVGEWSQKRFQKYTMNGDPIGDYFEIDDEDFFCDDLAYDGQYFYTGHNSTVQRLDLANQTKVDDFETTADIGSFAYNNNTNTFWVNNYHQDLKEIDTEGNLTGNFFGIPIDLDVSGSAIDTYSDPENPTIWLYKVDAGWDAVELIEYDLQTKTPTGRTIAIDETAFPEVVGNDDLAGGLSCYVNDQNQVILLVGLQKLTGYNFGRILYIYLGDAAPTYETVLTVIDENTNPVEGASVTIGATKISKITDENGEVTFSLSDNSYDYVVTKDCFINSNGSFEVAGAIPTIDDIVLNSVAAPLFTTGTVLSDGQTIELTFDTEMNLNGATAPAGFSVDVNSPVKIDNPVTNIELKTGNANIIVLTVENTIQSNDELTYSYTAGTIQSNTCSILLESTTDENLTNNSTVTNISEINNQFSIYPNPSTGIFTINLQASERPCSVSITNITGKIIYKQQSIIPNSQFSIKEKGIYFINIQTEKSIYSQKLIIQ